MMAIGTEGARGRGGETAKGKRLAVSCSGLWALDSRHSPLTPVTCHLPPESNEGARRPGRNGLPFLALDSGHSTLDILRAGYTLIELLVTMTIIGILLGLSLPAISRSQATAKKMQCANNLRNIALAMTQFDELQGRLPASGNFSHDAQLRGRLHHSWAVSILPWIGQESLFAKWDTEKPITDPINEPLTHTHIPIYVCPVDLSRSRERDQGDLSYVVNGGVGYTVRYTNGVRDCPVDLSWRPLDLNGDGTACTGGPTDDEDKAAFDRMGLFFLETWNTDITKRHHELADISDGLSQTFLVSENVRAGYDPQNPRGSFANSNPPRCAFYIGNPCPTGSCAAGTVDYSLCNAGRAKINSGRWQPEGSSPVPNSFHAGGVNMAYADGHVRFLSETVDGAVYAALASPQGARLGDPLTQAPVAGLGE